MDLSPDQLEAILERAAEAGSNKALERVGLDDKQAVHDVRDLRDLLGLYRDMKTETVKWVFKGVMIVAAGLLILAIKFGVVGK